MPMRHTIFDHCLFAVLLLVPWIEWRFTWPQFLARLASGEQGVRRQFYRTTIVVEWLTVLVLFGFWRGRPWSALLLGPSTALRLGTGMAVAVAVAILLRVQRVRALKNPSERAHLRHQLRYAEPLLPHDATENRLFHGISFTAGFCEETLFRGFLYWYLAVWTGPVAAVLLSSLVFGAGHIYMGVKQVYRAALAGFVFACFALASGSLWPAILLHAVMDWNSGEIGFALLGRPALPEDPA